MRCAYFVSLVFFSASFCCVSIVVVALSAATATLETVWVFFLPVRVIQVKHTGQSDDTER